MAERTRACTACHGEQGKAGPDGYYPRIAGKPAGYLYNQLQNFQQGRRQYDLMARLIEPLPDAYLRDMAQYFSGLKVPYPAPALSAELSHPRTIEGLAMRVSVTYFSRPRNQCVSLFHQRPSRLSSRCGHAVGMPSVSMSVCAYAHPRSWGRW